MKNLFIVILALTSASGFASTKYKLEIPFPDSQNLYFGSAFDQIREIKKELLKQAIDVCKGKENVVSIAHIQMKVTLQSMMLDENIWAPFDDIEGAYPLSGATAEVWCE